MSINCKNLYKKLLMGWTLISLLVLYSFAQEKNIKSIDLKIIEGNLNVTCHFTNLISEDMHETLASGMSTILNFHLKLNRFNGNMLYEISNTVKIRYDVWDKKYILFYSGKKKQFADYNNFQSFLYDSLTFSLVSTKTIPQNKKLQVILTFSPEKVSAFQKKKLDYWIANESETKESNPAQEAESGFSINISRLISLFLDNSAVVKMQEIRSAPFTLRSLRENENTSQ